MGKNVIQALHEGKRTSVKTIRVELSIEKKLLSDTENLDTSHFTCFHWSMTFLELTTNNDNSSWHNPYFLSGDAVESINMSRGPTFFVNSMIWKVAHIESANFDSSTIVIIPVNLIKSDHKFHWQMDLIF